MMAINEFAKELTTLPVYVEQAAELIHKGNKRLNKDSVVVTLSKSGDTKESVAIAEWCKAQGIRVVAITKKCGFSAGAGGDMAYSDAPQKWRGI